MNTKKPLGKFWRLESYSGPPNEENAAPPGTVMHTLRPGNPGEWTTHSNPATGERVTATWIECEDPWGES